MKQHKYYITSMVIFSLILMITACEKDYYVHPPKPVPKVPKKTETLEATKVSAPPASINSKYWKEADYLEVEVQNLSTKQLYKDDGLLNMAGTYNGTSNFNGGNASSLTLKAAYDDQNIYILAEWTDESKNAAHMMRTWEGESDPLKLDSAGGWTTQLNDDNISFAFDIGGASSTAGKFSNVGCAASCHNNSGKMVMNPESGKVDIWNWSLGLSQPLGYAFDMVSDPGSGLNHDVGDDMYAGNGTSPGDYRGAPAYEWDGTTQNIQLPDGSSAILDPAFYLLNKIAFSGDMKAGKEIYHHNSYGCSHCHGEHGEGGGDYGDGPAFNTPNFTRKFSRTMFDEYAAGSSHTGATYYNKISTAERDDLIAFIKGLGGLPGNYLTLPQAGKSNADIEAYTNVKIARITIDSETNYKVLFKRKLDTGHDDDVKFSPGVQKEYKFGVALMDRDGKNHVGSLLQILTFK